MKNTLSLENYGVAPLTTREMKTTNGGNPWYLPIVVGAIVYEIATDWKSFEDGLMGRPYSK